LGTLAARAFFAHLQGEGKLRYVPGYKKKSSWRNENTFCRKYAEPLTAVLSSTRIFKGVHDPNALQRDQVDLLYTALVQWLWGQPIVNRWKIDPWSGRWTVLSFGIPTLSFTALESEQLCFAVTVLFVWKYRFLPFLIPGSINFRA
jgi:hypothetical protein